MASWIYLGIAGFMEIIWAVSMKYTDGWTRLWPSVGTVAAMAVSMYCLTMAVRTIPIGTGYAIWTGVGAVGTAAFGMILFSEPATAPRFLCIGLIVAGIMGLKLTAGS